VKQARQEGGVVGMFWDERFFEQAGAKGIGSRKVRTRRSKPILVGRELISTVL
jgi:hypothetical protein